MRALNSLKMLFLCMVFWVTTSGAADLSGRYREQSEPSLTLSLQESSSGVITGTLSQSGDSLTINANRQGEYFSGLLVALDETMPISGILQGTQLMVTLGTIDEGELLTFKRTDDAETDDREPLDESISSGRNVIINGVRLTDSDLLLIEQTYQIYIPDADYWYDPVLGAWGGRGGPTMGFIPPGLNLGGPLQADASGGGTYVFVNGRELDPYDLMLLQQLTGPIVPGRYFITAQGYAGYEGGPALWNLSTLFAKSSGGAGGGSNSWQGKMSSGFSDGETSAVFLPNGGIVSTGN